MTTEELLALPEDGKKRWLIRGELRESLHAFHDRRHGADSDAGRASCYANGCTSNRSRAARR